MLTYVKLHIRLKLPVLTKAQIERFLNIFDNAGQVVLGVIVFSQILGGVDKHNISTIVLGIITVIICWTVSVWLAKKGERK